MSLHLAVQGVVDRSELLETVTVEVTVAQPDGTTVTVPVAIGGSNGAMPADPPAFRGPSGPGRVAEWLRATAPRPLPGSLRFRPRAHRP
jgi:hypothetical protein